MQYTTFTGARSESPATAAQAAQHKAFALTPDGMSFFSGITDAAQIASVYNTTHPAPNPVPVGTVQAASMPRSAVIDAIGLWKIQADAASNASAHAALSDAQEPVEGDTTDPVSAAKLGAYIAAIKSAGLDVSAQAAQMMVIPDPNYQATVPVTLACMVFGALVAVEASDAPILLGA